ncbi:MAG: hypothetical protein K2K85_00955 [Clostridia bacterium]|nr:hypothetical protein [Clostridia bacterium]
MIKQGDSMSDVNIQNFINDLRDLLISTEKSNIEDIDCYCIAYYWYLLAQQKKDNDK